MTKLNRLIEEQKRDARSKRVLIEYDRKESSTKQFCVENPGVYYDKHISDMNYGIPQRGKFE